MFLTSPNRAAALLSVEMYLIFYIPICIPHSKFLNGKFGMVYLFFTLVLVTLVTLEAGVRCLDDFLCCNGPGRRLAVVCI